MTQKQDIFLLYTFKNIFSFGFDFSHSLYNAQIERTRFAFW